jgi:predicted N-formylglutamate amidohydrolase
MQDRTGFRLAPDDPQPFAVQMRDGVGQIVLCCEHGGRALPRCLDDRAPAPDDMDRHIAWDVGAGPMARLVSEQLDTPLALQPYSRLVVDSNRPRHAVDLAPSVSDGSVIRFNQSLDQSQLEMRWSAIHQPFHAKVDQLIAARRPRAFVSIHSFTPQLRDGAPRPMAVGLLVRRDPAFALAFAAAIGELAPNELIVMNAPYEIEDDSDYTIPVHAEPQGLAHVLIEMRNDLIADQAGIERWGSLISTALAQAVVAVDDR